MGEVMVTGAAGGIGQAVVSALAEAGHQVTAVGRELARLRSLPTTRAVAADFAQPQNLAGAVQEDTPPCLSLALPVAKYQAI